MWTSSLYLTLPSPNTTFTSSQSPTNSVNCETHSSTPELSRKRTESRPLTEAACAFLSCPFFTSTANKHLKPSPCFYTQNLPKNKNRNSPWLQSGPQGGVANSAFLPTKTSGPSQPRKKLSKSLQYTKNAACPAGPFVSRSLSLKTDIYTLWHFIFHELSPAGIILFLNINWYDHYALAISAS